MRSAMRDTGPRPRLAPGVPSVPAEARASDMHSMRGGHHPDGRLSPWHKVRNVLAVKATCGIRQAGSEACARPRRHMPTLRHDVGRRTTDSDHAQVLLKGVL